MRRESFDTWEDKFIELCQERIDEEPFYPYDHLWKKNLSVEEAFNAYLEENEDLAEKYREMTGAEIPAPKAGNEEQLAFLKMAKALEAKQKAKNDEAKIAAADKLSKYCPECGRKMTKKVCRCGYTRR